MDSVFDNTVARTALDTGAIFFAEDLFLKTVEHITKNGYHFKHGSPIRLMLGEQINTEGELIYTSVLRPRFCLVRSELMVVANWMLQKLMPNMSWKRGWKRKDGRHQHWITTDEMTRMITFNPNYTAIRDAIIFGKPVTDYNLVAFAFFRNYWEKHGSMPSYEYISKWVKTSFMLMELMRELEYNTKRTRYIFD